MLTFLPVFFFGLMVFLRIGEEEAVMIEKFGDDYCQYMERNGKFPQYCLDDGSVKEIPIWMIDQK
ncbi:hypothetical protein ACFLY4_04835 [Chloroflexota bacterium]